MTLVGTIVLFAGIGAVIALAGGWPALRRRWKTAHATASRESAQQLLEDRKRVRTEPLQPARIEDFRFRGYGFYDRSQRALEHEGYTLLGDFSLDHAVWIKPGFRTFVRVMRSDDRSTVCSILDATPHPIGLSAMETLRFYLAGFQRQRYTMVSLRTELTDGRFIITASDADFPKEQTPPAILRDVMPSETPLTELLARHRDRVAGAIGDGDSTAVTIGSVEDFGQSFLRQERHVRAWREGIGFAFTDEEQRDFVAKASPFDKEAAKSLLESMRRLENEGR